jgi:hypothetical protein
LTSRGCGQFGGETVQQSGESAQPEVGEAGDEDRCGTSHQVVGEAAPARASQVGQPRTRGSAQVWRVWIVLRWVGPGGAFSVGGFVDPGEQGIVHGAEQGHASGGECGEVVLPRRARLGFVDRFGNGGRERGATDRVRECVQSGHRFGLRAEQTADQGVVETCCRVEGFGDAVDGLGEQVQAHHRTASAGANHCISGSGVVLAGSSR